MHHMYFTAEKHSAAIYEQNLSKLTCFTEAAEAVAMLSRFSRLLFVVSLGRFIQTSFSLGLRDSEIQISKCEIPRPALFFRARDSETPV